MATSGTSASDEAAKARLKREGFEAVSYGNYYRHPAPGIVERIIAPWYGGRRGFYAQIEKSGMALRGFGPASLAACLKWLREQATERTEPSSGETSMIRSNPRDPRKPIVDIIEELRSWLPNYDHGPDQYPTLLFRILASLPGGDEMEDIGYEGFNLGWHEAEQLERVLAAIQDKTDVEDLVRGLLSEEEEEDEAKEARPHQPRPSPRPPAPSGRHLGPTRRSPVRRGGGR